MSFLAKNVLVLGPPSKHFEMGLYKAPMDGTSQSPSVRGFVK